MNLKNTENVFVLGLFLAATGLVSALLLAVVAGMADQPIRAAKIRNANLALKDVLPPFDNQPGECAVSMQSPGGLTVTFKGAKQGGKLVAIAAEAANKLGYGGEIVALTGLNPNGSIRSVLITSQHETPGLGTKVCERKVKKTVFNLFAPAKEGLAPNRILDQFGGRTAGKTNWKVKKDGGDVDFVTGATVTSRAVTDLVSEIDRCYLVNRAAIEKALTTAGGNQK